MDRAILSQLKQIGLSAFIRGWPKFKSKSTRESNSCGESMEFRLHLVPRNNALVHVNWSN